MVMVCGVFNARLTRERAVLTKSRNLASAGAVINAKKNLHLFLLLLN
jgi:hypothetical protein